MAFCCYLNSVCLPSEQLPVNTGYRKSFVFYRLFLVCWAFLSFSQVIFSQTESSAPLPDLSNELGNKYYDAVDYLLKNPWMADTLLEEKIRPDLAFSAVIPQMMRYSALRDLVEGGALRTLYIQSGRKYSHYSTGRFQMKASFAELVERNYSRQKMGPYKFILSNTTKARSERARRLESDKWQLRYLVMFVKLMDKRYAHIKWKNDEDKARFYATAFDVGFNRDMRTIERIMTGKTLSRKSKQIKSKYRTGDVAVWFMINDGHRFRPDHSGRAATGATND